MPIMQPPSPHRRPARVLVAVVVVLGSMALSARLPVGAASTLSASGNQAQCGNTDAAPRLTASRTSIGANETATVTVTGTDYLLPPHVCGKDVFGGIYLFFGWVAPGGQWGPSWRSSDSDRGLFGTTFSYPGEGGGAETRDDGSGTVRLVAFTRGGESGTATDFHMDGAGNWSSNLTIRGATYRFTDLRTGDAKSVDCRVVQCGVFTIGAHAKSSRTNEQFTPINFTDPSGAPITPSNPTAGGAGGASGPATPAPGAGDVDRPAPRAGQEATGPAGDSVQEPPTTSASPAVGSVGEAPEDPDTEVAGASESAEDDAGRAVESELSASVQHFGAEAGGGSSAPIAGGVVALLVVAGAVALVIRNKRAQGAQEVPS